MNEQLVGMAGELSEFEESVIEFVGSLDRVQFENIRQMAQGYLTFDVIKDLGESILKRAREGRELCAQHILTAMEDSGVTSVETAGKRFTSSARGHFNKPSKRKKPLQYEEFMEWMRSDDEGKLFMRESLDSKSFNKWCQERMEQGKDLPLHCSIFTQPTVKVRALRT